MSKQNEIQKGVLKAVSQKELNVIVAIVVNNYALLLFLIITNIITIANTHRAY